VISGSVASGPEHTEGLDRDYAQGIPPLYLFIKAMHKTVSRIYSGPLIEAGGDNRMGSIYRSMNSMDVVWSLDLS